MAGSAVPAAPAASTGPTSTGPTPAAPAQGSGATKPPSRRASGGGSGASASGLLHQAAGSGSAVDSGAGVVLGYLLYVWVLLPLVQGGPTRVKNVWRAKFFNKDAKGNWLP